MKNYTITVNGNVYDVTVEEKPAGFTPAQSASPAPAPAPAAPQAPLQAAPAAPSGIQSGAGRIAVKAGAAGKVFKIEAAVGQSVQPGDPVVIIEAMKMEIEVSAPKDGIIEKICVKTGDSVSENNLVAIYKNN